MAIDIPGLIAKENESKGTQRSIYKENSGEWEKKTPPLAEMKLNPGSVSYSGIDPLNGQFVVGDFPNQLADGWKYDFPYKQQPYIAPQDPWQNPGPFGPDPYKKYGPPPKRNQDVFDQEELMRQLAGLKVKKSAFEELIDQLFTTSEKEQVLIDMGYEFAQIDNKTVITRKLADGTIKTITNSLDDLFLKEITVKFKNLLMAKASLKLKL
jgi:hypothetical protein